MENGYQDELTDGQYPLRALKSGQKESLELVLNSHAQDVEYICSGTSEGGFNIYVTAPGESLQSAKELQVKFSEDIQITIKSKIITTAKALRSYSSMQRGCFYDFERQLRFFKSYTENNCLVECLANLTKKKCECVGFSMPSMRSLIY